jgi:hypothetical protein
MPHHSVCSQPAVPLDRPLRGDILHACALNGVTVSYWIDWRDEDLWKIVWRIASQGMF